MMKCRWGPVEFPVLPIGAISITVHVPFEVKNLTELVVFHDLQFSNGSLHDEVKRLAELTEAVRPWPGRAGSLPMDPEATWTFWARTAASAWEALRL